MIIIVSSAEDPHLPFVTKYLRQPPIILDASNILGKEGLTYAVTAQQSRVIYKGKILHNITGVWVRRPCKVSEHLQLPVLPQDQKYCASAIEEHLNQLYVQFPDAVWVSDWYAIRRASNKTLQLRIAADLGFAIPDTILTSSPDGAKRFVDKHGDVVIKPLSKYFPKDDRTQYMFPTHKIAVGDPINYNGLHLAPVFFQTAIEHLSDIRVTVVGEQVFATKIVETIHQKGKIRDWRVNLEIEGGLAYEAFKLPRSIERMSVALVKRLGLRFGAIDLVEDEKGHLIFLEVNPNGQWAFIEMETGQEMGKSIAALLEQRKA